MQVALFPYDTFQHTKILFSSALTHFFTYPSNKLYKTVA